MKARARFISGALTALAAAVVFSVVTVAGQAPAASAKPWVTTWSEKGPNYPPNYKAPRTPWGDPDLQGIWNGNDLQGVGLVRNKAYGDRMYLNDQEFAQRVAGRDRQLVQDNAEFDLGDTPPGGAVGGPVSPPPHWLERAKNLTRLASFLIDPPDGQLPAATPEAISAQQARQKIAQARRATLQGREADSYTDRSNYDRCISLGVAGSLTPKIYNSGNRIVQGPGWLAFQNEMIHETRIIPTDSRPSVSPAIKSWMGTSTGRWEGETLVVTTTGLKPESQVQGYPLSDQGKIIERFTRVAPDTLEYKMTVDDPKTWTRPWTMMMPIPRDDEYVFPEYACHEGNYTMFHILSGSRLDEKLQAEAAAKGLPDPLQSGRGGGGGGGRGAAGGDGRGAGGGRGGRGQ